MSVVGRNGLSIEVTFYDINLLLAVFAKVLKLFWMENVKSLKVNYDSSFPYLDGVDQIQEIVIIIFNN